MGYGTPTPSLPFSDLAGVAIDGQDAIVILDEMESHPAVGCPHSSPQHPSSRVPGLVHSSPGSRGPQPALDHSRAPRDLTLVDGQRLGVVVPAVGGSHHELADGEPGCLQALLPCPPQGQLLQGQETKPVLGLLAPAQCSPPGCRAQAEFEEKGMVEAATAVGLSARGAAPRTL